MTVVEDPAQVGDVVHSQRETPHRGRNGRVDMNTSEARSTAVVYLIYSMHH